MLWSAPAVALNPLPRMWAGSSPFTGSEWGFSNCWEANAKSRADIIAYEAPRTVIFITPDPCVGTDAWNSPDYSSPSWLLYTDYRRADDFPTTLNRTYVLWTYCDSGGFGSNALYGKFCNASGRNKVSVNCPTCVGNPVLPGTGIKVQQETDYEGVGSFPLRFVRVQKNTVNYDSDSNAAGLGYNWWHTYHRRLRYGLGAFSNVRLVGAERPDGRVWGFARPVGAWVSDPDVPARLEQSGTGWVLFTPDDETEVYDNTGRLVGIMDQQGLTQTLTYAADGILQQVTDHFGRTLVFTHDTRGHLTSMTDPNGGITTFTYSNNTNNNLLSVTHPDSTVRRYHYETAGVPSLLTGITDELNVRFATYSYLPYDFTSVTTHAGNAGRVTLAYPSSFVTTDVTTHVDAAQSATRTYTFQTVEGVPLNSRITGPACPECGPAQAAFDVRGNTAWSDDWNGNRTWLGHDTRNLPTARVEGFTPAGVVTPLSRQNVVEWHPRYRLPARLAQPRGITTFLYNGDSGVQCGARGVITAPITERDVVVTNGTGATLTDYAASVDLNTAELIFQGKMARDGGVRVLDSADADLPYWIDGPVNSAATRYWFKVPVLPPGASTFRLRFGAGETFITYQDRWNVFPFFDDFSSGAIDPARWTVSGTGFSVVNGRLRGGANATSFLKSVATFNTPVIVTSLSTETASAPNSFTVLGMLNSPSDGASILSQGNISFMRTDSVWDTVSFASLNAGEVMDEITMMGTQVRYRRIKTSANATYDSGLKACNQNSERIHLGTRPDGAASQPYTNEWRAIFARPYLATVPTVALGGDTVVGTSTTQPDLVPAVLCRKTIQPTLDNTGLTAFSATPTGAPRAWEYTYDALGRVLTEDGPRTDVTDVTVFTYHADNDPDVARRGRVSSVTNALGHAVQFVSYDGAGRLTSMTDPNGVTHSWTYDARGRLLSETRAGEVSGYTYNAAGLLTSMTQPDGTTRTYAYDAAHRLVDTSDAQGNRVAFTLDYMGHAVQTDVYNAAAMQVRTQRQMFNNQGRLVESRDHANNATMYTYDNQGNLGSMTPPGLPATVYAYDTLNRLTQVTRPGPAVTTLAYDANDALVSITDPALRVTSYTINSFGEVTAEASPDTGSRSMQYDAAGNLVTESDAQGRITTRTYDVLNRLTAVSRADGSSITYVYDLGIYGVGRLSRTEERDVPGPPTLSTSWTYDARGRVVGEAQVVAGRTYTTLYAYDAGGRLTRITYPSGRAALYSHDALGRVQRVELERVGGGTQVLLDGVTYAPWGGVVGWTFGNGQTRTVQLDGSGRVSSYGMGPENHALTYDPAGRISNITETGGLAAPRSYVHDALSRIVTANIGPDVWKYEYDAAGNRTSRELNLAKDLYSYVSGTNRLQQVALASGGTRAYTHDADGAITGIGANTFQYDQRGRMTQATTLSGSTAYQYNARGQRVSKARGGTQVVYHRDLEGRLLAESDGDGQVTVEYVYVYDLPVGVLQ